MAKPADRRSWKPSRYLLIQVLSTLAVLACVDARAAEVEHPQYARASLVIEEPVPVVVWNRTITEYRASIADSTAELRAARSAERIARVPFDALEKPIQIAKVTAGELSGLQLIAGNEIVITLIAEDMPPESGQTLEEYAAEATENLAQTFAAIIEARRPDVLVQGLLFALGSTIAFIGALMILLKLRHQVSTAGERLLSQRERRILDVDTRPILGAVARGTLSAITIAIALVLGYLWVSFVLSQFPYSQPLAARLGNWLIDLLLGGGHAIADAIPGLLTAILIFFLTRLTVRAVGTYFRGVELKLITVRWLVPGTVRTTRLLVSSLIWMFGLVIAYPHIPGSDTDAFKGVSVMLGVMLSLGSAGLINQIMSGLVIVYSRALNVGDIAKVGDVEGVVQTVGLLSTRLLTPRDEVVTVPNAVVVSNRVISYVRAEEATDAQLAITVTIGYDAPWRQVHALLLDAAARTEGLRFEPAPYVLQRSLGDFYVEYELRAKVDAQHSRFRVPSDLHAAIQDAFNEADVQILSPHFEAQPAEKVVSPPTAWRTPPGDRFA